MTEWLAGIDAGGTSFKCGVADGAGNIVAKFRVGVTTPEETIGACLEQFEQLCAEHNGHIAALGIASFGPLDRDSASETYGVIGATPKSYWSHTPMIKPFSDVLKCPIKIDTDVNGALIAEMVSGAAKGAVCAAYITIGTGIGAGLYANGGLLGQSSHPEFGHIHIKRHAADDFSGACGFHDDCLEGLASATAIRARFGPPEEIAEDHILWDIESYYLAQACQSLYLTLRTDKIILGGGVMQAPFLLDRVRDQFETLLAGYAGMTRAQACSIIHRAGHGDDAGLEGAFCLAREAREELK